jgi:hypothetical protein
VKGTNPHWVSNRSSARRGVNVVEVSETTLASHAANPWSAEPSLETAWWHPDVVALLFRLAEFWWLILPLVGMIVAGLRALSATNERRGERQRERYRIAQQDKIAVAEALGRAGSNDSVHRREITRLLEEHNRTDARWLDYEIDVAKLLDFPMMTDMRDPLTVGFHKAKLRADVLRPVKVDDLLGDRDAQLEYLDAVHEYVTAFEVAEAEAIRRRRSDFSALGQQRLARAQGLLRLASDSAATPQERQHAYDRARKELDGLIVLPATTRASIERRIAGQIEG